MSDAVHNGMSHDPIQGQGQGVKVTRPLKLEILQFSKSISSAIFNVSWQMTTDSETTEQYLTFEWSRFLCHVTSNLEGSQFSLCFCNCNYIR